MFILLAPYWKANFYNKRATIKKMILCAILGLCEEMIVFLSHCITQNYLSRTPYLQALITIVYNILSLLQVRHIVD